MPGVSGPRLSPTQVLRGLVIRSGRLPRVGAAWVGVYHQVIREALRRLRPFPTLRAVYLCRGCARGQITPGLSDIDLTVVTTDPSEHAAIRDSLRTLQRHTGGLVDYHPRCVATLEQITRRWSLAPIWRFRYWEGQESWRLLHGEDVLSALGPPTPAQRRSACYAERCRWWVHLAEHLHEAAHRRPDPLLTARLCYKAVAEIGRVERALETGRLPPTREEGLAALGHPLARRLEDVARRAFDTDAEALLDATLGFLIQHFGAVWGRFAEDPPFEVYPDVHQVLGGPTRHGSPHHAEDLRRVARLSRTPAGRWVRGLQRVWGVAFGLDEQLLLVEADPGRPPRAAELRALLGCLDVPARAAGASSLPYLRVGEVLFPLSPQFPLDLHRGLLTPATAPDVFLQLGRGPVYWTEHTAQLIGAWRENEQWEAASDAKRRQLAEVTAGVSQGRVLYPLGPSRDPAPVGEPPEIPPEEARS